MFLICSFGAKTMKRKILKLLAGVVIVASCGLEEIGGNVDPGDDVWFGPGSIVSGNGSGSGAGVGKRVWYAVGVDYPEGYDWKADEQKGSVKCSLVVFANGVPMMKVPVGEEYEVSADPDMHRMVGNSLYTDYSTNEETIIKKNGESLFRYAGREMIIEMTVDGDDVYTLGLHRDGRGFAFRKNGEVLLERPSGYAFSRIQQSDAGYCFAFCETIGDGNGAQERYFHYMGGSITQVAVREDVRKVWDIIFHDGHVCYVASMVGIPTPVLVVGDEMNSLGLPAGSDVVDCRFVSGDGLSIEGVISQKGKALFSGLWNENKLVHMFSPGYTVASVCMSQEDVCSVLNAPDMLSEGIIYRSGESLEMPQGFMSMGGRSLMVVDGMLYVGLTSVAGGDAAIWVDNEMKPLKINGFISYISSD